jgi:hypothetical protein
MREVIAVNGSNGARLEVNVKVENNTLCLACHAGFGPFQNLRREDIADFKTNLGNIANATMDHTRHGYDPEGRMGLSRCTECHMARMATSGDAYDMASHTFEVVAPEKTLQYQDKGGMPNSCAARCHRPLAPIFGQPVDLSLTNWTEASDRSVAEWLKLYFGPDGAWWRTR